MRLLRLWPDESHFDFMRFRRVTFPLSAVMSVVTLVLFITVAVATMMVLMEFVYPLLDPRIRND